MAENKKAHRGTTDGLQKFSNPLKSTIMMLKRNKTSIKMTEFMKNSHGTQAPESGFQQIPEKFWSDLKALPTLFMFEAKITSIRRKQIAGKRGLV